MSIKKQLMEFINGLPDDEEPESEVVEQTDTETAEEVSEESAPEPDYESEPSETTIEPSVVEETEVIAAEIPDDVTVLNSNDLISESLDMRFSTFYAKQQELETALKVMADDIKTLKQHFTVIEKAIDTAAETSPTVESLASLINQL